MNAAKSLLSVRRAGVLLHPTSLPSGTLGADARRFVDFLADGGFSVWQVLPLGPVDANNSPYQLSSAFAGNTSLLDPADLAREPWWSGDAGDAGDDPADGGLIAEAWQSFRRHADNAAWSDFADYRAHESTWLVPYALFAVLGQRHAGAPWWDWEPALRERQRPAVASLLNDAALDINAIMFGQFLFARQWQALRDHANQRGVHLFGDLPFYVDRNSADVWWRRSVFQLDAAGSPTAVAGVPPDYFNADGQWWGNPLYDWDALRAEGYRWWLDRLAMQSARFDMLRIDHFRALESCWAIPSDAATAREGQWLTVPGDELLAATQEKLPDCSLVAEDLGTITPAVTELRTRFGLPGMLVLQFAFDGSPDNPYLPANHVERAVVYTGTHDNDTTQGWYASLDDGTRRYVDSVVGSSAAPGAAAAALVRAACASPARLAVLPLQDLLGLGSGARMNTPGTVGDNWGWRFEWPSVDAALARRCRGLTQDSDRLAGSDSAVAQAGV